MNLTHLHIDFEKIRKNIDVISEKVGHTNKIILVIKADGYGIGAIEYASQMEKIGIHSFAVARVEEAIELREHGNSSEIIVLANILIDSLPYIVKYNIVTAITDFQTLKSVVQYCNQNKSNIKVHLNINTGMHRLGIKEDQLEKSLLLIESCKYIRLMGIFTHFASADDTTSNFTNIQGKIFKRIYDTYKPKYPNVTFHSSNSSATMEYSEYNFDKVRVGIAALGYSASDLPVMHWGVQPSLKLTSKVLQIQTIEKGDCVGYNQTFIAKNEMVIATIGIGYADGLHRCLAEKGSVIIANTQCKILGSISMDLISVDVTSTKVNMGDEVILFGKTECMEITLEALAKQIKSVPYEIITQINPRVQRVYEKRI